MRVRYAIADLIFIGRRYVKGDAEMKGILEWTEVFLQWSLPGPGKPGCEMVVRTAPCSVLTGVRDF